MTTTLENGTKIVSSVLTEDQHNAAVEIIKKNLRTNGNYTAVEADEEMVKEWAKNYNDESVLLNDALEHYGDVFTLMDQISYGFAQPLGEFVVY